jgi:hypothetical protein
LATPKKPVVNKCIAPWGHNYNYFDYCTECGDDRPW